VHSNLGSVLKEQSKLEEAAACYRKALALSPSAELHYNLAHTLGMLGEMDAAIESYHQALLLKSDLVDAHYNLGNTFQAQGKPDAAVESYGMAISSKPDFVDAHYNLGNTLKSLGKLDAAIESYRKVLAIEPDHTGAQTNLGNALLDKGEIDAAVAHYRNALALKPDFPLCHSNLFFALSFSGNCVPEQYLEEARRYGSRVTAQANPYTDWPVAPASRTKPLRIGLVSGDLRAHPVGFFLEGILTHLNPAKICLIAYSSGQEDGFSERIKPRFAVWNSIVELSDEAAAREIHEDGVDILIDLAGHTGSNRLPLFAWKPAPVQASWLGYWATTGVPAIDYFLADAVSVPQAHVEHFTETVWYLPDTRLCFTPPARDAQLTLTALPASVNGYLTFGCFQKNAKINDAVLAVWGRIFEALPQARLRLQNMQMDSPATRAETERRLAKVGILPHRVTIEGGMAREDYFAAHANVDIILDTFPYPGGTTTCEALWMGVPTVTLAGDTLLGRQGASMLSCAGLPDWIANDADDYLEKTLAHAADIDRLATLRRELRQQVLASPLFDAPRFARHLEDALQAMWRQKMHPHGANGN
jgi:predicted O-linked N-acetylglucosamine transferase (SPINDLY family)